MSCVTFQRGEHGMTTDSMLSDPPQTQDFGSGPILRVGGKDESLLRFDLSSIPSSAVVNAATLKLYINGSAGDAPINLHRATMPWAESTVTFASFGQHFAAPVSGVLIPGSANALKSVDVSATVGDWVRGAEVNYGFLLETTSSKKTIFVSSDAETGAKRPALEVCYTTPDNHCAPNPCQHGECINGQTDYSCSCDPGWVGTQCDQSMHACDQHPCQNGALCTNASNAYSCACAPGYIGTNCETLVDNCAPNPCLNDSVCTNSVNHYDCSCRPGYTGTRCEALIDNCAANPCAHGACTNGINAYSCACASGWTGVNCEVNIDDCAAAPCLHGAVCVDGIDGFTCACAPDFGGAHCENNLNECSTTPCLNGGSCTNSVNTYSCSCPSGFTGANCEVDINDCNPNPCRNGGGCTDRVADYQCTCPEGASGKNCEALVIFSEAFEQYSSPNAAGTQCNSGLSVYYGGSLPGWTASGGNAMHAVRRPVGGLAAQLVDTNQITMTLGVGANDPSVTYEVSFDAGPSVWAACSQSTQNDEPLEFNLLRDDDSVLATYSITLPAWQGSEAQLSYSFTYLGDGTGNVRLQIADVVSNGRFAGDVDNVAIKSVAGP